MSPRPPGYDTFTKNFKERSSLQAGGDSARFKNTFYLHLHPFSSKTLVNQMITESADLGNFCSQTLLKEILCWIAKLPLCTEESREMP